jgi:hypothetical protein
MTHDDMPPLPPLEIGNLVPGAKWRHVEGGRYDILRCGVVKLRSSSKWEPAVTYLDASGKCYTTTLERWLIRFKPI